MENAWIDELRFAASGGLFTQDPARRAENIGAYRPVAELGPAWLATHDVLDDTAVDPDLLDTPAAAEFETAIQRLGAIGNFLYNMGTTSVLVEGSIATELNGAVGYPAVGFTQYAFNAAATSATTPIVDPDETIGGVATHEAAHAFSFGISNLFLRPVMTALHEDLSELSLSGMDQALSDKIGIFYDLLGGINPARITHESYTLTFAQVLCEIIRDDPELQPYFERTTELLRDYNFIGDAPVEQLLKELSDHPRIVAAYASDLEALLPATDAGTGRPDGAYLAVREVDFRGTLEDRACIIIPGRGGECVAEVGHYVPEMFRGHYIGGEHASDHEITALSDARAEALAEAFEDVFAQSMRPSDFGSYFPNLIQEVRQIVAAAEYHAAHDYTPENQTPTARYAESPAGP